LLIGCGGQEATNEHIASRSRVSSPADGGVQPSAGSVK